MFQTTNQICKHCTWYRFALFMDENVHHLRLGHAWVRPKNWGYNNTTIRLPFKYADRSRPFLTKTCLLRIMWQTNARATTIMTGDGSITTHTHGDLGLGACPPRCLELSAAVAEAPQSDSLTKKMRLGSLAKTKLQCHRQLRIVYILYTYMKYRWKQDEAHEPECSHVC